MKRKPNHYHLQAVSGRIVEHFHTTPGRAHEHDGLRRYATTRRAIEKQQTAYLEMRRLAHEERVGKAKRGTEPESLSPLHFAI